VPEGDRTLVAPARKNVRGVIPNGGRQKAIHGEGISAEFLCNSAALFARIEEKAAELRSYFGLPLFPQNFHRKPP
jgi:hypothetical protein